MVLAVKARISVVRVRSFVFPMYSNERTLISLVRVISEVLSWGVVVITLIKTVTLTYIITDIIIYICYILYIILSIYIFVSTTLRISISRTESSILLKYISICIDIIYILFDTLSVLFVRSNT